MKRINFLLFAVMFIFLTAFESGTVKVYDGQVILEDGEVLKGKLEMLSPTLNEVKVKFIDDNGATTIFKAKDVQQYSFVFPVYDAQTKSHRNETITYVKREVPIPPVPFGPKVVLLEQQVSGTINLYNFFVETREAGQEFSHNYFAERNGQLIEINRENFKVATKELVADYPQLQVKVGTKGFGYKHIAEVIAEYNAYFSPKGVFNAPLF
jgi:hypothetical protein